MNNMTRILLGKYLSKAMNELDSQIKLYGELANNGNISTSAREYFESQIEAMQKTKGELKSLIVSNV